MSGQENDAESRAGLHIGFLRLVCFSSRAASLNFGPLEILPYPHTVTDNPAVRRLD
jgi:hypothetical protein